MITLVPLCTMTPLPLTLRSSEAWCLASWVRSQSGCVLIAVA